MPEIRFDAKDKTICVIDGYCNGSGRCRTAVINEILEEWAKAKLHESIVVCRVAGVNPEQPESDWK